MSWRNYVQSCLSSTCHQVSGGVVNSVRCDFSFFKKWNSLVLCDVFMSLWPSGPFPPAQRLGELLHRDSHGNWAFDLHYELHHWQEQEQPASACLAQLSQRASGEELCPCRWEASLFWLVGICCVTGVKNTKSHGFVQTSVLGSQCNFVTVGKIYFQCISY